MDQIMLSHNALTAVSKDHDSSIDILLLHLLYGVAQR